MIINKAKVINHNRWILNNSNHNNNSNKISQKAVIQQCSHIKVANNFNNILIRDIYPWINRTKCRVLNIIIIGTWCIILAKLWIHHSHHIMFNNHLYLSMECPIKISIWINTINREWWIQININLWMDLGLDLNKIIILNNVKAKV